MENRYASKGCAKPIEDKAPGNLQPGLPSHYWIARDAAIRKKIAKQPNCWICDLPITEPNGCKPLSRTKDHIIPKFLGGKGLPPHNFNAAHYACNHIRGIHEVTTMLKKLCRSVMMKLLAAEC